MRVCAIFRLRADTPAARVIEDAPKLIAVVQSFAKGPIEPLFRSSDNQAFGWFFEVEKPLRMLQSSVEQCTGFQNGDAFIVFEVGSLFDAIGFTRAWTWLQHHPAKS